MPHLILMRHGQSVWNQLNLFTGWVDVPLSQQGVQEAIEARKIVANYPIDIIYTSSLVRALMTAMLVMIDHPSGKTPILAHQGEEVAQWSKSYGNCELNIPVRRAWQLNERMYGQLQGLNKQETIDKYGQEQVHQWRRSYDEAPPGGESLQMTAERAVPYFNEQIFPQLDLGHTVLIAAHGNSLRAIIMELEKMTREQILKFELATGRPRVYEYDRGKLRYAS